MLHTNRSRRLLFLVAAEHSSRIRQQLFEAGSVPAILNFKEFLQAPLQLGIPDLLIVLQSNSLSHDFLQIIEKNCPNTPLLHLRDAPNSFHKINDLLRLQSSTVVPDDIRLNQQQEVKKILQKTQQPSPGYGQLLAPSEKQLRLQFFGQFQLRTHSQTEMLKLPLRGRKLLAYLLLYHRHQHKESLSRIFWPYGGGAAINSLHQTVFVLRKQLNTTYGINDLILYQQDCYFINPLYSIKSDWEEFQSNIMQAENSTAYSIPKLEALVTAYQLQSAPLLEEVPQEEESLLALREKHNRLRQLLLDNLLAYTEYYQLIHLGSLFKARV